MHQSQAYFDQEEIAGKHLRSVVIEKGAPGTPTTLRRELPPKFTIGTYME